jgi:transposase-like protein
MLGFELERNHPSPTTHKWRGPDGERHHIVAGTFRVEGGWGCTLWLGYYRDVWEVAGLTVHAAKDEVGLGPVRRDPHGDPFGPLPTTKDVADADGPRPETPVSTRLLRELPLGAMAEELRRYLREHEGTRRLDPRLARQLEASPGRRGRPDEVYAEVAAAYVDLVESGTTTSPVKALAEQYGYSVSAVNNWVAEARNRGLLSRSPRGKAGGHLTERARQLLDETEDDR